MNTLLSAGTVEEKIGRVLEDKQALADLTIGSGEDWLSQLSDDRLFELLALDEDEDGEDR